MMQTGGEAEGGGDTGGRVERRSDRGKGGSVEGQEPPATLLQVVHCQEDDNISSTGV